MAITGEGWELELIRLGQHQGEHLVRTYGSYAVYIDGQAVEGLTGFICECQGPGQNERRCDKHYRRRIREGTYPLYTHDTHYASVDFSRTSTTPTYAHPMPGFGIEDTDKRSGILVHPAHDGGLFLSSIGCLNPTGPLRSADMMDIDGSRSRVIDLLNSLRAHYPAAFKLPGTQRIREASIIIVGEPTDFI
jgi:hypothetical protein